MPPADTHGFWYLSYSKAPGDFETRSMAGVLDSTDPAGYFKDKIILIDPCAAGLQDSYFTSKGAHGHRGVAGAVRRLGAAVPGRVCAGPDEPVGARLNCPLQKNWI